MRIVIGVLLALFACSANALSLFPAKDSTKECKNVDKILQHLGLDDLDDVEHLEGGDLEGLSACERRKLDVKLKVKAGKKAKALKKERGQAAREAQERVAAIPDLESDYLSVGHFKDFHFQEYRVPGGSGADGDAPYDANELTVPQWMSIFINLKLTKGRRFGGPGGLGDESIPGEHLLLPPNTNLGQYFDKCDECVTHRHAVEMTKDFSMRAVVSDRQSLAKVAGPWVEGSALYKTGSSQKELKKGDSVTQVTSYVARVGTFKFPLKWEKTDGQRQ